MARFNCIDGPLEGASVRLSHGLEETLTIIVKGEKGKYVVATDENEPSLAWCPHISQEVANDN